VTVRIIAGTARGRRLAAPPGEATRPTSDRAREGLFSTLASLRGGLSGARVLDLYAGSGAVGLEALSRGAAHALLVESQVGVAKLVRANVRTTGLPGAEVVVARVERLVAGPPPGGPQDPNDPDDPYDLYDIAFLDPPYAVDDNEVRSVLSALLARGWLTGDALVVVERATRGGDFDWPGGYAAERSRRYGEGTLWYGRAAGPYPPVTKGIRSCDESSTRDRSIR
jgi:16S rRNA (guanine966-N2)-methyltransferase